MNAHCPRGTAALLLFPLTLLCLTAADERAEAATAGSQQFTAEFDVDDCSFSSTGTQNPYFRLKPGYRLILEGSDEGELVKVVITVLHQTKKVQFAVDGEPVSVTTRIVEEREYKDGEIVERSLNYYARCKQTNDVFYFGEDVDICEDGVVVGHDGSWLAGKAGALPGIIIPARFLLGSRYYQELAPGVALDRAEHVEMGLTVDTPFGTLDDCVRVVETTPLEPGAESVKIYSPDVGLVVDNVIEVTWAGYVSGDDDDD